MAKAAVVLPEPQVADPVQAAMAAFEKGETVENAIYGSGEGFKNEVDDKDLIEPQEASDIYSNVKDADGEEGDESVESDPDSEPKEAEAPLEKVTDAPKTSSKSSIEEVFVKGADGKRQAVKVDYENRDLIKRAYMMAAGFPALTAKLGTTNSKYLALEKEHASLKTDMDKLESVYKDGGLKGLAKALGREEDIKKLVDEELRHREYIASLSPDEKYRLEVKQQQEAADRRAAELEAKYTKKLQEIEAKEEQAATQSLESRLHPAFDRYRFAGKLGDEAMEHMLDETIWNQVVNKRLVDYPDDVELTQAIIDKEFRAVAQNLQKVINTQTEKKVQKTVDKKKVEAMESAQLTAKKGLATSGEAEKFKENIKSGNFTDAIASFMTGKVKL